MKISAIIPCYNEELTIKQVIEDIKNILLNVKYMYLIIILQIIHTILQKKQVL